MTDCVFDKCNECASSEILSIHGLAIFGGGAAVVISQPLPL